MSDIKSATFRLSKDSTEAFRQYCEDNQLTAAQGFEYMLEVLALNNARNAIQTRETEITNFEQHTKALISAYLHSLELNENAEARIKEQFTTQLQSQAQTISEYQEQINEQNKQLEEAISLAETFQEELATMQKSVQDEAEKRHKAEADLQAMKHEKETQLADKNNIISMLTTKLADAEQKASEYNALKEYTNAVERSLTAAEQTIKDNAKDAEIARERAVRTAEKALEAEHRKEIQRIQSQNTELLQTIAGLEKSSAEQIRAVEKENATLREKLAKLSPKNPPKN